MDIVTPGIGLIFWTTITFILLILLLRKFAWKPILEAVHKREESIENALKSAEKAKEEMAKLQADNEAILKEAKLERDKMIKEARELKEKIISEAKQRANEEQDKIIAAGKESIKNEIIAAEKHLKNTVAKLSVDIAEKLLKSELSDKVKQENIVNDILKDIHLN